MGERAQIPDFQTRRVSRLTAEPLRFVLAHVLPGKSLLAVYVQLEWILGYTRGNRVEDGQPLPSKRNDKKREGADVIEKVTKVLRYDESVDKSRVCLDTDHVGPIELPGSQDTKIISQHLTVVKHDDAVVPSELWMRHLMMGHITLEQWHKLRRLLT